MVFLKKPVKIGTGECCLKNGLKKGLQKFWCSPTTMQISDLAIINAIRK
jgi:hypothetical protein